jgi:hypothetical protein
VGRGGAVAVDSGEASSAATDDGALALHHEGGGVERRVGVENDGKGARLAAHRADERQRQCG